MSIAQASRTSRPGIDARAAALLLGLCALWGLQQVGVKLAAAGGLPPVQQAAARSVIGAACLCAWVAAISGPAALRGIMPRRSRLPGAVVAVVFGVEFAVMFAGLRLTTASRGVLLIYTAPFFTALAAHVWLGERLGARGWAGLVVAFAGVSLLFAGGTPRGGSLAGDALCAASAVLWAANTVVIKASGLRQAGARSVLFYQLAGSAPILLAASLVAGETPAWPHATALAWACLAYQGVVVAFASYLAWFWLVLRYPAGRLSGFTFFTPICGVAAGAVVLGESVGPALLAGIVAVAAGLRLLNAPISTD
jgi:drug/metabolite transporter (DMT)-like permease